MKQLIIILALLSLSISAFGQTGTIEVEITDIVAEWGGTIRAALFDKSTFPKAGEAIQTINVPVRGLEAQVRFDNVPEGNYALAVYQDINGDSTLNRDVYRRPTEPYGFSKNKFGRFGPPKYENVDFEVRVDDPVILSIWLKE